MKIFLTVLVIVSITNILIFPCTTAVVSGKATDDGRPLLLKNRDADALQNKLAISSMVNINSSDSLILKTKITKMFGADLIQQDLE